jgi:hypothetical protein
MTPPPENLLFRPARPDDKQAVLAISAHFPNDWLRFAFDAMTEAGRLFVAEETGSEATAERVVAVCGYNSIGDTAWLQAMRSTPTTTGAG